MPNFLRFLDNRIKICRTIVGVGEILFFTTLPTITLFLYAVLVDGKTVSDFIYTEANAKGEFLLYSLALLSSAYTTAKYYREGSNLSLNIVCLIATSILYTLVAVLGEIKKHDINYNNLAIISLVLFVISIIFTYQVVKKQVEQSVNAKETNDEKINDIENKVVF